MLLLMQRAAERSGWYPALDGPKRKQLIERDVEQHWHLMMTDARKRLEQCQKSL
jgi:hypothetical protein